MKDRMTVTDIARHLECTRPTAYKIVGAADFPARGLDKCWASLDVMAWLDRNAAPDAVVVGGVLVKSVSPHASDMT